MKALLLFAVTIFGTVSFLRWRDANIEQALKTRQHADAMLAQGSIKQEAADKQQEQRDYRASRVVTWLPGHGWVEHDRRVTALGSMGGGYYGPRIATPVPRTMLDQPAHR